MLIKYICFILSSIDKRLFIYFVLSLNIAFNSSFDIISFIIEFRDRGIPFNPLLKDDPDTTLSAEERKIGGLGIFMVKKSMDDISYRYEDGQNILRIIKKYKQKI